jgi:hypothetical protein
MRRLDAKHARFARPPSSEHDGPMPRRVRPTLPQPVHDFGRLAIEPPEERRGFRSSGRQIRVEGRVPPPGDPIHDPLLDRYSRETGVPRETVTQHERGYESFVLGTPLVPPAINITLTMPVPAAIPSPDESQDVDQLGAWELAKFRYRPRGSFVCDHVVNNGIESSFVTAVGIEFTQSTFQYFIARHVPENMRDQTREPSERVTWRRIFNRIGVHAREHFARYRQVTEAMEQTFRQRFAALPTRHNPIRIPQADLEAYMGQLLLYLLATLEYALWRATCDWERADYPNLLQGIPNVSGRFAVACDPQPAVPPEPVLPIVVTPGPAPRRPPARRRP